ncbi:hypothetical protein JOF36_003177 [Pseudonocardia parietis]|uniref:Uncharacterized protein n=1 Tax=Pseudonocardia parietis TaxID=570936 RepID=A0ABS4VUL4_9PSEU|nr:hypothetical protein [Pseudonocardia parietis]
MSLVLVILWLGGLRSLLAVLLGTRPVGDAARVEAR